MRIQVINPNTCLEMTQSIAESASKVAAGSTEIVAVAPTQGVVSIEGHYDEAIASFHLLELIKQGQSQQVDGHIIACFGDPGLDAARELTDAPVIGIAEAAFHMATLIATKFSIVTTLKRTKIIAEHLLHQYGYIHKCEKIHCIDLPVLDLEKNEKETYDKLLETCWLAKENDGVGAIVLGCGGMSKHVESISKELNIPVIDGVTAAVKLLEALHGLGLRTSKWGDYDYPNQK
ncbi:aspartate/glutamate racemase family protein [Acinetobacter ursingii]|jgi:allantoin racemase|uniref:Hydantoin racemase n=1 Tax=Acinetobacter haemolyticus ATCC 19194 TaxID=707232 RepID=D4XKC9_ACIHA|nr:MULTISPECIES: aspartate/glutamate racemase family protein [Acinetobacter]EFF84350.1 Asp/Glu/Hydantoin racemase [Acinetobacter haemolyticus ATCC 19194]MDH2021013.1 aspartate/glutamate racemase family protein [Acinetobacter ursingii]MDH2073383.1 aspartate/glutamate racemase family protein [Acinetobacter ursingii]